jgi:hypothetical protein
MSRVVFREKPLDTLLNSPNGDVGMYMKKRTKIFIMLAKAQAHVRTGMLRKRISADHTRLVSGQKIVVTAAVGYALMHHEGTRPHVIMGHQGRRMRFVSGGKVHYATRVMHPGTRPNRFLSDNLRVYK